jgi:hypothetical protein
MGMWVESEKGRFYVSALQQGQQRPYAMPVETSKHILRSRHREKIKTTTAATAVPRYDAAKQHRITSLTN